MGSVWGTNDVTEQTLTFRFYYHLGIGDIGLSHQIWEACLGYYLFSQDCMSLFKNDQLLNLTFAICHCCLASSELYIAFIPVWMCMACCEPEPRTWDLQMLDSSSCQPPLSQALFKILYLLPKCEHLMSPCLRYSFSRAKEFPLWLPTRKIAALVSGRLQDISFFTLWRQRGKL